MWVVARMPPWPPPTISAGPAQWWMLGADRVACLQPFSPPARLARGVLFDLPHVASMAQQNLETTGLSARCRTEAGDFFKEVPAGGDIYLLRKVIHDWDDERARHILRICRSAMTEGSRLLLLEMVVPAGNTPSYAKLLDLLMLVYAGGRERTESEYRNLLISAGFSMKRTVPFTSAISIIEATPG